jgi:nitronate monooxygenase
VSKLAALGSVRGLMMKLSSRFTDLVGSELPIQLAALGGVGTTELAAAVVAAGGCGMVPRGREAASGACGVNFLLPFEPSRDEIVDAAGKSRVVEFFYGDPQADLVRVVHDEGALAGWQVGSADEAAGAEGCGCDYVVAQGTEAGGHVRGNQSLAEILPAVQAAVQIPVVAAGGVATAERFAEVMQLGADAVRVGTRFVACPESGAHPEYVRRLLEATGEDTLLTEWFGEGWEAAPHRVLRSAFDAAQRSGWRRPSPPEADVDRDPADMAMYAGTGVGHVTAKEPAAAVVADLVSLL